MKFAEKFRSKLKALQRTPKPKTPKVASAPQSELEKLNQTAYPIIGERIGRALPIFKDLDLNLQRAGVKLSFRAYVSITLFTTLLGFVSVLFLVPLVFSLVLRMALGPAILFGVGAALLTGACATLVFYFYPVYQADKHKRELEDELPFTTGYMAILANAGVSPEKIFSSLANLKDPLAASTEAKDVTRHINLFGLDIISALEKTAKRTPSEKFQQILEGIISTMHSGGGLGAFLQERFRAYIRLRKLTLKKYGDTLSMLAEVYVALLLTAPLLFVIMLSVMSVMGGGMLGAFSSDTLLQVITYIGIPMCALIFLITVDSSSPKW